MLSEISQKKKKKKKPPYDLIYMSILKKLIGKVIRLVVTRGGVGEGWRVPTARPGVRPARAHAHAAAANAHVDT